MLPAPGAESAMANDRLGLRKALASLGCLMGELCPGSSTSLVPSTDLCSKNR
jgi:hypothetical protein